MNKNEKKMITSPHPKTKTMICNKANVANWLVKVNNKTIAGESCYKSCRQNNSLSKTNNKQKTEKKKVML